MYDHEQRQVDDVPSERLATASTTYRRVASSFWDTVYAITVVFVSIFA